VNSGRGFAAAGFCSRARIRLFPTGALLSNMPDVVHGGFKVVGNASLKAFSVYVVDRNKPLYDWAK
jgi:hypothetical protein